MNLIKKSILILILILAFASCANRWRCKKRYCLEKNNLIKLEKNTTQNNNDKEKSIDLI